MSVPGAPRTGPARLRGCVATLLLAGSSIPAVAEVVGFRAHYEGVLGTSMDLDLRLVDEPGAEARAEAAFAEAVAEAARLEALLSTYRSDSALGRLNRDGRLDHAPSEVLALLDACATWEAALPAGFSCRLGRIVEAWNEAERTGDVPDRRTLRRLARDLKDRPVEVSGTTSGASLVTLPEPVRLDPGGIGKGFVIDRLAELLRTTLPDAGGIVVDIGGDARFVGSAGEGEPFRVGLAPGDEHTDTATRSLHVRDAALASSGHAVRARVVGRRSFSHILAPRDGWPVPEAPAAYVRAPTATAADAIATALTVLPSAEAIAWVDGRDGVEALLVLPSGRELRSRGWSALETPGPGRAASAIALQVDYAIPELAVSDYHRPYVAIWLADAEDGAVLRHLLLLGESPRWARENGRWWRSVAGDEALLDGFARPTRRPGRYQVRWDGRDDFGRPVTDRALVLHLEAAREDGGHDHVALPLTPGTPVVRPARGELGAVEVQWTQTGPTVGQVIE